MTMLRETMNPDIARKLLKVGEAFRIPGPFFSYEEIKMGNVNHTYKVNYIRDDGSGMAKIKSYLVQRVNTYAFQKPLELMANIDKVTEYIHFVEEDSPEADKAGLNLNIYWAFAEGFLKETAPALTEAEAATLGNSCFTLACELSTRFLDDYIIGDKYFKIKDPKHNLTRTRCQIALAKDMRKKMDAMNAIVRDGWNRYRRG